MDEYLEKLFAEAYKRELEQEETVIRSLPFIAAAAAIIVAVLRAIGSELPGWRWQLEPLAVHVLLILSGVSLVYAGWFVFQALRRRPFRYPRGEAEIRAISAQMVAYHRQAGLAPEAAEAAALLDLRREMINQYAVCAENNRRQNEARQAARTQAFHGLIGAFFFVVVLSALSICKLYRECAFMTKRLSRRRGRSSRREDRRGVQERPPPSRGQCPKRRRSRIWKRHARSSRDPGAGCRRTRAMTIATARKPDGTQQPAPGSAQPQSHA